MVVDDVRGVIDPAFGIVVVKDRDKKTINSTCSISPGKMTQCLSP